MTTEEFNKAYRLFRERENFSKFCRVLAREHAIVYVKTYEYSNEQETISVCDADFSREVHEIAKKYIDKYNKQIEQL